MSHKGLRCWELDFVLIAVTHIFVHHRCFKVFWSKMAEKGALSAIPKRPPLWGYVREKGPFLAACPKSPCQRGGGGAQKGPLAPHFPPTPGSALGSLR